MRRTKLLEDAVVGEYVNRIGHSIAKNSDAKSLFNTKVVDATGINALAVPGDFLYINAGLILVADNESQLAAVMAHMMTHVAARHASENEARGVLMPLVGPRASILAPPRSARFLPGLFYKFSRPSEEEADFLGAQYLYKAGYDATAMVSMFQKLSSSQVAGQVPDTFDTHLKAIEQRVTKLNENIKRYFPTRKQNIVTTKEFQNVQTRVITLTR